MTTPLRTEVKWSVRTKVVVPMVAIMAVLLGLFVWTVNQRITEQFQAEAVRSLGTAEAVFQHWQTQHKKELLLRYRNLPNEPRYRAVFQAGDLLTAKAFLAELVKEQGVDVIWFTGAKPGLLAWAKRDPLLATSDLETNCSTALRAVLQGEEKVYTILARGRLFDIVSLPVFGTSGAPIGVLTFGSEISDADAQQISLLTRSRIVLLTAGQVIASSEPAPEWYGQFAGLFDAGSRLSHPSAPPQQAVLNDEHYYCSAGRISTLNEQARPGYLLLISYEQALRGLNSIRQVLLWVSGLGILLGSAVVWFVVRQATTSLRALRDTAEAVGRGDFSRRVEVAGDDECGELAAVFNWMTENLKESREQLEQTVETLKTTQAQLIQSEKLSGIGEFVAGVAHELNNPLTTVMGFSELLAQGNADPQQRRPLEMLHKSALRCQKIVQSLLSFARRHPPERKLANINGLIEAAVDFLHYQLRTSNIEVTTNLDHALPPTMVDPHQLQQVFLNIINNARQAMEGHRPKGRICITTARHHDRLRVCIQDDGPGIAKENLPKLFNPFFTTKAPGKGTGLGLSLCYGIVRDHGGAIQVRSEPGAGATFAIELPLVAPPGAREEPAGLPTAEKPEDSLEGAGKRVLVIDDEESILEMVQQALSRRGYQVDTASDGEAGLRCLDRAQYDLTLCDWKMPGLSGEQVYERLAAAHPTLSQRFIFMTGDVISGRIERFLHERHKVCLAKPFSLADFRQAIEKSLS